MTFTRVLNSRAEACDGRAATTLRSCRPTLSHRMRHPHWVTEVWDPRWLSGLTQVPGIPCCDLGSRFTHARSNRSRWIHEWCPGSPCRRSPSDWQTAHSERFVSRSTTHRIQPSLSNFELLPALRRRCNSNATPEQTTCDACKLMHPMAASLLAIGTTPVPPAPRYELVIHEWKLQSVAIDRTGKSPNVIEDTNFQGKGIGRFLLPPGDQLKSGTLDVVRTALEARNAGSVSPLLDDSGRTPETPRGSSPVSHWSKC